LRASSRYLKENYRRIYVRRELHERLRALAEAEGLTIPDLLARMCERYAGAWDRLLQRLERLEAEVAELRKVQEDVRRLLEGGRPAAAGRASGADDVPEAFREAFMRWWRRRREVPLESFVAQAVQAGFSEGDAYAWAYRLQQLLERRAT
jgi:hypothetical protein